MIINVISNTASLGRNIVDVYRTGLFLGSTNRDHGLLDGHYTHPEDKRGESRKEN